MIRRPRRTASTLPAFVAFVAAALVTASCSAIPPTRDAFTINGTGYPADKFAQFLEALSTGGQFQVSNGKVNSETYSTILRTLVRHRSYLQWAEDAGLEETAQDRADAQARAQATPSWTEYPDAVKEVVVDLNAAEIVIARATLPTNDELRAMYERAPASTGALCMSHIIVATKSQAQDVMARLDAGEKFADLAREVSIEPAAKDTGGALGNSPDNPCQTVQDAQISFDGDFVTAVVGARAGVPTGPVKSSFGWHVVLNRPFDEIGESLRATISENTGNSLLTGWMTSADIELDPRYGTWNTARGAIE